MASVLTAVTPAWVVLLAAAVSGAGCSDTVRPADAAVDARRSDGAVTRDAVDPEADRDLDGVCDATEAKVHTDPTLADSDGDGLTDAYELLISTDPINPRDPDARDRVPVVEGDDNFATVEHFVRVSGSGAPVIAYWQDRTPGPDGRYASELVRFEVAALDADPMVLVRAVDGPRFVGVTGFTTLHWRVTVRGAAAGDAGALGCRRAYEALVVVGEEGGDALAQRRLVIDVRPRAPAGTDLEFCAASSCF